MAGLDASTAATIAALVVAILAMLVAITQAIQQYFLTGQLIRLCDSVVYGKMPGHGQRVWQMSQLRFRVVYYIPQISLRKELWPGKLPHIPSYAKGSQNLPDLGLLGLDGEEDDRYHKCPSFWRAGRSSVSFAAGEASWVSFCRAVQPSTGRSMVLDLIKADADRCPPDLPNVPIQMSMRDIVVMGLMTGMKCTQASFESKTISMQGLVGTITTSQHPLLGPLLHFSPRNLSVDEIRDLQLENGTVNPPWMARIWDEVVVAGHRYTRQDRMQIERDEAIWAKPLRERAMVPVNRNRSPPPASLYGFRRRSSLASTTAVPSQSTSHEMAPHKSTPAASSLCQEYHTLWTRSDGEWYIDNNVSNINQAQNARSRHLGRRRKEKHDILKDISGTKRAIWVRLWTAMLQRKTKSDSITPSENVETEVEAGNLSPEALEGHHAHQSRFHAPNRDFPHGQFLSNPHTHDKGAALQPRWFIKDYIDQKRAMMHEKDIPKDEPRHGPRLIGWYDDEGQEVAELNEAKENLAKMVLKTWARSKTESGQQRAAFYAQKWRDIVRQRQLDRESCKQNRTLSYSRSFRSLSPGNPYRSSDLIRSRKTIDSGDQWPPTPTSVARYSSLSGYYSPRGHHSRKPITSAIYDAKIHSRDNSSESRQAGRTGEPQTRSSSHVRSRPPARRDVEYGDTVVSGNSGIRTYSKLEVSESPTSQNSAQNPSYTRVGFGPEIHLNDSSSGSNGNASETERLSSSGEARISSREEPSINQPDPIEPTKGILKPPKEKFPEEPNPVREGVAPLRNTSLKGIPSGARWTKIDRRLVSPAALETRNERFEEGTDYVVVLRVLQKEEIQEYASTTQEIRGQFMPRNSWFTQLITINRS